MIMLIKCTTEKRGKHIWITLPKEAIERYNIKVNEYIFIDIIRKP